MQREHRPASPTVIRPLLDFLARESTGAVLLVAGAIAALAWANSPWSESYHHLWETLVGIDIGSYRFELDLHGWVNDGLMALFFLVVGLEIKRELVEGELASPRSAALPAVAALGGMVVPALAFVAFTAGTPEVGAWGIPMATDIALAMGVLTVAGRRLPSAAKVFLLALAIVDDLGAIIVIAVAYSGGISALYLLAAAACVGAVALLGRVRPGATGGFVVLGLALWFFTHEAGVHATLAGVAMGLLTPTTPRLSEEFIDIDEVADISSLAAVERTIDLAKGSVSRVEWLEHRLHPWTSLMIVPIFALANAGITIDSESVSGLGDSRVAFGIIAGLVVGKPVGITAAVWLGRRLGLTLPEGMTMGNVAALGTIAGIGFTVSIFVAGLAIDDPAVANSSRLAILVASLVAATLGSAMVALSSRRDRAAALR